MQDSNKTQTPTLKFPNKFIWGSATAAYQIEGHPEEHLAKLSDWSEWIEREDKVLRPTNDGRAVNHYEHMVEDVKLIRGLNSNAYRFSFNWARLHRGPGEFDNNSVQFYKSLLDGLRGSNPSERIEPFATIIHFVLPNWLAKDGGWENPNTAYEFANFTKFLVQNFGDRIKFWITHNEPNIFLGFGYESGIWPPGYENDWNRYFKAYQGLLLGHQLAYQTIKESNSNAQIGFAQNLYCFETLSNSAAWQDSDSIPNIIRNQLHNHMFIESCLELDALDFLGVNYYTRFSYKFNPQAQDPASPALDASLWGELRDLSEEYSEIQDNNLGWELYAEGLYKVLSDSKLRKLLDNRPIYITENGYCHIEDGDSDIEDPYRIKYIQEHLVAVHKVIQEGVNIQGYFYWSLLDNFEWALGMKPRFGLIHVDHDSFVRTPKASYHYYAKVAAENGLPCQLKPTLEKSIV